jgi:hypothetical protein
MRECSGVCDLLCVHLLTYGPLAGWCSARYVRAHLLPISIACLGERVDLSIQ